MSAYFQLPCCSPQAAAKAIVICNIIIVCLGGVHWGYCGVIGKLVNILQDKFPDDEMTEKILKRSWAYIAITGIFQVLTSVGVILLALSCLGQNNKPFQRRFILLLILSFAFNFAVATSASMDSTFYNYYWSEKYLQSLDNQGKSNSGLLDYARILRVFKRYTIAEAVLTFALALPLITVTVIALLDHSLKEEGGHTINQKRDINPQTRDSAVQFQQRNDIAT